MSSPNNNYIVPDVPQMRSVLIRSAPAPSMPLRSEFNFLSKSDNHASLLPLAVVPSTKLRTDGAGSPWKPCHVPKLPVMYPLERSHVSIPDADAIVIAERIAECLRSHSIAAKFHENKAVAETACHTQFFIKLFEDDSQIIVEVQRRTGCCYAFMQCTRAILRAAKGQEPSRELPRFVIPDTIRKTDDLSKMNEEAIERSFELLQDERMDSQLLGMQCLIKLSENFELGDRLAFVLSYINVQPDDDDSFAISLRRDALTVLANSFALSQPFNLLSDDLLRTLISEMTSDDLHSAHQAARCLTSVCQHKQFKQLIAKMGASSASSLAREQGVSRHNLLEQEARILQLALE